MAEADILLSGAKVWYAPVGEALPDETTIAWDAAWDGNWVAAGRYMSTKGRGIQSRSGAIYAWWIEDNMPFIYPALLSVAEGE